MSIVIHTPSPRAIARAAKALREGKLVIFPTETLYGLGAISTNSKAITALIRAKRRPKEKGFIVLVAHTRELTHFVQAISPSARALMRSFWPGPLTLVFRKKRSISSRLSGNSKTIAIRYTSHPVAKRLIKKAGKPITAPSANISGDGAPRTVREALKSLGQNPDIAYAIDAHRSPKTKPSTIVDVSGKHIMILREGAISSSKIFRILDMHTKSPYRSPRQGRE